MRGGRRLRAAEPVAVLAARAARSLATLPEASRSLVAPVPLVAEISAGVRALAAEVDRVTGD
jgi:hypothetical protein